MQISILCNNGNSCHSCILLFLSDDPPQIIQHPEHQLVATEENVTFSIKARGDNLTFQWVKDDIEISDDKKILGSHTETLNILRVTLSDHGCYKCLVGNDVVKLEPSRSAHLLICKCFSATLHIVCLITVLATA